MGLKPQTFCLWFVYGKGSKHCIPAAAQGGLCNIQSLVSSLWILHQTTWKSSWHIHVIDTVFLLFVCLFACLFFCLLVCLFVCLCVRLFVCLFFVCVCVCVCVWQLAVAPTYRGGQLPHNYAKRGRGFGTSVIQGIFKSNWNNCRQ